MKVLLVDDARTVTLLLQVYLMDLVQTFLEARNGMEGLELAKRERPDLVISDVQMPGSLDGYQLCTALRADPLLKHVPVFLLSTLQGEQSLAQGKAVGATLFLRKPVSAGQLRAAVLVARPPPLRRGLG